MKSSVRGIINRDYYDYWLAVNNHNCHNWIYEPPNKLQTTNIEKIMQVPKIMKITVLYNSHTL